MIGLDEMLPNLIKINSKNYQPGLDSSPLKKSSLPQPNLRACTLTALNDKCEAYFIERGELMSNVGYMFKHSNLVRLHEETSKFMEDRLKTILKNHNKAPPPKF
jgi:hypothetical protein